MKGVAETTGLDEKAVAGMVGAAMRYPASYRQLMGAVYMLRLKYQPGSTGLTGTFP